MVNIVFAGTPDFALPSLDAVATSGHRLVGVLTQPDRPAGRGRRVRASPIKERALALDVAVQQPRTLKDSDAVDELQSLAPDLIIVAAYGLILPPRVLALAPFGCINVHASVLPRWRGAAPIQRAILAGDAVSGVSIMKMEAGLDTGPVFLTRTLSIAAADTGGTLHDRLAELGAGALLEALPGVLDRSLLPQPQDDALATYAHRLQKAEAQLDWSEHASALERRVRAFDPWPVCYTDFSGLRLRIWGATPVEGSADAAPGTVIAAGAAGIDVATGSGVLRLTSVQAPGRRPVSGAEFARAHEVIGGRFR